MDDPEAGFLARFVLESDAIEGIRNDPATLWRQVDEERNPERLWHAGALLRLRDTADARSLLTAAMVQEAQALITADQHLRGARKMHPAERGDWRQWDICITGGPSGMERIGSRWQDVPTDMDAWLAIAHRFARECRTLPRHQAIRDAAFLHWRYERIHPFADGNGRSGRALAYYCYRLAGLEPFVFTDADKHERYYPCFRRDDAELMERYFLDRTR